MIHLTPIYQLLLLWLSDENPPPQPPGIKVAPDINWLGILVPLALVVVLGLLQALIAANFDRKREKLQQERIGELEQKAEKEPEKIKPAWDLARANLEAYFSRNLSQVRNIFYVAVAVMVAGFCFILWGLGQAVVSPGRVTVAIIGAACGVITQFIGLTFMIIYRSTMTQANQFMIILERINTVGMAVQILEAIDDKSSSPTALLKDVTRVDIIKLLLAQSAAVSLAPYNGEKQPNDKGKAANA